MGSDFCSCLNDLTGGETEDLSLRTKEKDDDKRIDKRPKVVLKKQGSLDSSDPLQSQKENNSISTNLNSDYKSTLPNHQKKLKSQEQKKELLKKNLSKKNNNNKNSENDINIDNDNKNTENIINIDNDNKSENKENTLKTKDNKIEKKENKNIEEKKNINDNKEKKDNKENKDNKKIKNDIIKKKEEEEIIDFDKILNREEMVSENFNKFFNSQKGQEMILNMDDSNNKICITLHKYLVSLITRRKYKKNLKYFKKEGEVLFQKCLDIIYKSNPNLIKLESVTEINYTPDGFLKYYSDKKDLEKMKFVSKKESFDNCIIIFYEDDDTSSLDKMLWIYKGQVNKIGEPHGFGEKINKNGIKEKGYWKEGEFFGWGMKLDSNSKIILIGPFYDKKNNTGLGQKFTWKKRALYTGELIEGEKNGKGEEDSSEGTFVGNFYHDKKNGKGKMIYKISGDIYEGDYKNDLFDGQGHYLWKMTGQEYTGEYKNGLMHGKGLYEWSDGEFYKGSFVNGKKEGEGELHWGNGRSYIGPFVNGRPNGIGIYDNGINFRGEMEFVDGKMNINYLKRKYTHSSISTVNQNEILNTKGDKDIQEEKENILNG